MFEPIKNLGDNFIWVTSLLGGGAVVWGLWIAIGSYFRSPRDASLLGVWFTYGYFHSAEGAVFYKEKGEIRRNRFLPWIFEVETKPLDGDGSTIYKGALSYHAPYLYFTTFEPIYHDRTFEIYCRRMNTSSESKLLFGIHLGRSFDEGVHTACAVLMSRGELDENASAIKLADEAVEKREFMRLVGPYFVVDKNSLQLMMFQSPTRGGLSV